MCRDLTVADWHRQAKLVIRDILARGKLPVVTGGTMLYLRWLLYGQPLEVGTDAKTRRRADDFIGDPTPWDTKSASPLPSPPLRISCTPLPPLSPHHSHHLLS